VSRCGFLISDCRSLISISNQRSAISNLLLLLAAASAQAQPSLIDQLFERHVRVKAVVGQGVLHLLYERKADPQAPPSSCYRRCVPGKGWLPEERLFGAHRAVAFLGDALYVFRRENYSVYKADDWSAEAIFPKGEAAGMRRGEWQTVAWPLPWAPQAACPMDGDLWVFGVEGADGAWRIRAAGIVPGAAGDAPKGPLPFGGPLQTSTRPSDLSAIAGDGAVLLFWRQGADGAADGGVWQAAFDGSTWTPPLPVPVPYPNSDYAVARHEGAIWLIAKARGKRITDARPLTARAFANGKWGQEMAVPDAADPRLDWTLDIEAVSADGALHVFRACMDRVVAHSWADGRWGEAETLIALSPWPTYLFWWLLANVAASLLLLPVVGWVAIRVRARPRAVVHAFGTEVRTASWTRRVAAQLVDIILCMLLSSGVLRWLEAGVEAEAAAGADGMLATVGVWSAVFFAYFVLSEGLTGQSFGKLLLRIAVVGLDGRRPSPASVLVRNLLRPWPTLVPVAYLVGSLTLLLTRGNQRLGDILAGTLVVDLPPPAPSPWPSDED